MTGRHRPAPRRAAAHANARSRRPVASHARGHRRPSATVGAVAALGDVWGEAVDVSMSSIRRMPRPVVIPLVAIAALALALTAAAAPGGNSVAPAAAPQWPYSNWVIPTVAPDLAASSTIVGDAPGTTAKASGLAAAKNKKKPKRTTNADARTYNAVPAALAASGIPAPAMKAYKRAAAWAAANDSKCALRWELLAAIGRVESGHGTTGDSVMTWSGLAVPGIYGPVLDGRGPFALIRDTEDGKLDRDKRYDRAVGPMQFLPASWKVVGRDGDNDGKLRVQDIDDAAAGAAVYLCAGKLGTGTAEGLRANIYRYNRSDAYVNLVIGVMEEYGANVPKIVPAQKAPKKKPSTSTPSKPRSGSPAPKPKPTGTATPKPSPGPSPSSSPPPPPAPTDPPPTQAPGTDPPPDPNPASP